MNMPYQQPGAHEPMWCVHIDNGSGIDIIAVPPTKSMQHVFIRIGQMALSDGIKQIIVYRDNEEHRRYILKHEVQEREEPHEKDQSKASEDNEAWDGHEKG